MAAVDTRRAPLGLGIGSRFEATGVRDVMLAALAFASGATDAIAFLGLGKVFCAFMTGNLVFAGLSIAGADGPDLVRVAVALVAFVLGVYAGVRVVKATRGTGIWPPRVSLALGIAAVAETALLAGWAAASGHPSTSAGHLLVGLYALALGIQSAAIMSLDVKGVFTTAATATLIMLASDEAGWPQAAGDRRRLVGVIVGLVVGAAAGAFLLLHARSWAPALPAATTIAVVATASVALRRA